MLRQEDFTTASRLSRAVNQKFGAGAARALDGRNVEIKIPAAFHDDTVGFIADRLAKQSSPAPRYPATLSRTFNALVSAALAKTS